MTGRLPNFACATVALGTLVFANLFAPAVFAEEKASDQKEQSFFLEVSPPREKITRGDLAVMLNPSKSAQLEIHKHIFVERAGLHDTSKGPITVCFAGGQLDDHPKIAKYAQAWEIPGSSIKFDFGGSADEPSLCAPSSQHDIRVGFGNAGTWSLVGIEAKVNSGSTMSFDMDRIDSNILGWVVRHEFGHALGLYHEHQNPSENCEEQIDWHKAAAFLKRKYRLSDEHITQNFRTLVSNVVPGPYDDESIMLYPLPAELFRAELLVGNEPPSCLRSKNESISSQDRAGILLNYPEDPIEVFSMRLASFEKFREEVLDEELDPANRAGALAVASIAYPWEQSDQRKVYVDWTKGMLANKVARRNDDH